jgi:hypothetical protein
LQKLTQLSALTLLAAAEPLFDQQQQQQWLGMDAAAAAAQHQSDAAASSSDSPWLLLLQLPQLRELVAGVVPRSQTLNLTTTLTHNLEPPPPYSTRNPHTQSNAAAATADYQSSADQWLQPQQQQQVLPTTGWGLESHRGRPGLVLQQQQQQGLGFSQGGWFLQGLGGQRYSQQEGAGVTAYVTPSLWRELADMQVILGGMLFARSCRVVTRVKCVCVLCC